MRSPLGQQWTEDVEGGTGGEEEGEVWEIVEESRLYIDKIGRHMKQQIGKYCKSGNFHCKNIFVVDGSYEN